MCEKSMTNPWNLSYPKINEAKRIKNITSNSSYTRENCVEIKGSRQKVKNSNTSQERNRKTKQYKTLNRLQHVQKVRAETRYKIQDESVKKNGKRKILKFTYMRCKDIHDKVRSSKKVPSQTKKEKIIGPSSYTSLRRKEILRKVEKIMMRNTKMKF